MKKILYIETGLLGGGSFESLYLHLTTLDRNKYEPFVIYLNETKYVEKLRKYGIECFIIKDFLYNVEHLRHNFYLWKNILRFRLLLDIIFPFLSIHFENFFHRSTIDCITKIVKDYQIDLIHVNNQVNRDLFAIICAYKTHTRCVSHLRSYFSFAFNKTKSLFVDNAVTTYIAYSRSIKSHWEPKIISPQKIEIVNNCIKKPEYVPVDLYSQFQINPKNKIVGIVGNIVPFRGHQFLLDAFCKLIKTEKNIHLLIVGEGERDYVKKIKKQCLKLGLSESVTFADPVKAAVNIISSLDVLVLPYNVEPFGRVLLEAWYVKTPVVLSDVGYIRDIATDNVDSVIYESGNIDSFNKGIIRLCHDNAFRTYIIENGYATCMNKFSMETYQTNIEQIYNNIFLQK